MLLSQENDADYIDADDDNGARKYIRQVKKEL